MVVVGVVVGADASVVVSVGVGVGVMGGGLLWRGFLHGV